MAASPSRRVARYSCFLLLVLTGFVGCGDDSAPARHPAGMGASGAEGGEAGSGTGAQPGGEGGAPAKRPRPEVAAAEARGRAGPAARMLVRAALRVAR